MHDLIPVYKGFGKSRQFESLQIITDPEEDNDRRLTRLALAEGLLEQLSPRERQIMELYLYRGLGVRKLAKRFHVSKSTIEKHIERAAEKLKHSKELKELI